MPARPLRGSWVPTQAQPPDRYRCQRCGIEKPTHPTRPRPQLCADCKSVLRASRLTGEDTPDENPDRADDTSDPPGADGPRGRAPVAVTT